MENFKDLLNFIPTRNIEYKNVVQIDMEWDYDYGDFVERHKEFEADEFFRNEKLIWALAYLDKFGMDIKYQKYIDYDALFDAVSSTNLWACMGDYPANSLIGSDIIYYDENGESFDVMFDDFNKRWDTMTEEEICKEVNDVLLS